MNIQQYKEFVDIKCVNIFYKKLYSLDLGTVYFFNPSFS